MIQSSHHLASLLSDKQEVTALILLAILAFNDSISSSMTHDMLPSLKTDDIISIGNYHHTDVASDCCSALAISPSVIPMMVKMGCYYGP